jgi:putative protein-disulfide isomerase
MKKRSAWFLLFPFLLTLAVMKAQSPAFCDPVTGICIPLPMNSTAESIEFRDDTEIIYVGDPMCSWCWGISPQLNQLQREARQAGIPYRIVVGGLRPGGGDPWNDEFRNFLRHHWEEVHRKSGQPFGYDLFDRESFDYDTEPACRAVVAVRQLAPEMESRFFEWVQHHFYVQNRDPGEVEFYQPICEALKIDFDAFRQLFESPEVEALTRADFQLNRQWGVSGFPTVLLRKDQQLYAIARGYAEFEDMWERVQRQLK